MRRTRRAEPSMNVTPLVDVVLVLLIIFMVVIPAMTTDDSITLPAIAHADEDPKSKVDPFVLTLEANGALTFEKQPIRPEDFQTILLAANRREPGRRLMLKADKGARYTEVRRLFGAVQSLGFPGVSLRVNQRGGGREG